MLGPVDAHFYRLLWQPAAVMHISWWHALGLDALRSIYQTTPRARPCIDRSIMQRRALSTRPISLASAGELTPVEQKIVGFAEKLPVLIPALGLLRLGRAEYWMLRNYREALPQLNSEERAQLNVLAAPLMTSSVPEHFRLELPLLDPEHLAQQATSHGAAVLVHALQKRPLLGALEVLFEPSLFEQSPVIDEPVASFGLNLLFRLARFL